MSFTQQVTNKLLNFILASHANDDALFHSLATIDQKLHRPHIPPDDLQHKEEMELLLTQAQPKSCSLVLSPALLIKLTEAHLFLIPTL